MNADDLKKMQEREALRSVIAQWNANRLDLFELSEPNEDLEFHGVMRFYFQDSGQKVATKCIRVASTATSTAVIETLIEKFRPDMRMLSIPEYALFEIHENGDERQLSIDEKPLLVQLNWHKDDREGRFLLRRIDDKTNVPAVSFQEGGSFKRKLSKREKKQLKKQEKISKLKNIENDAGVAEKLYTELPETSFTRSISNPEAVMRRRRQQKLEKKLQQFRSKDGGPDTGGTLKIYGESLCRDVPYKTLLLSVRDNAAHVVKEMLAKYGLDKEDGNNFCLVQVNAVGSDSGESKEYHGGSNREYILDEDECPLAILMNHPSSKGSIMFHVRRRPADYHPRKRKKKPQKTKSNDLDYSYRYEDGFERLPFLLELNPDGSDIVNGTPKKHRLQLNVTEVGSERSTQSGGQFLQLFGPNIQSRHCVIAHTEGIVTVTPCSRDAETYVNNQRIYETTILQNGSLVRFGRIHIFRFLDPSQDERLRNQHDSGRQTQDYGYDRQSSKDESVVHRGSQNYETTFDVDGNVETVSTSSQKEDTRSQRSVSSREGNRSNYERFPRGQDPILPAVLEFREETEDAFLHAMITDLDPNSIHFKLAPTYALYLAARFRASTHYRPELTPTERAHRLTNFLGRVGLMIQNIIQARYLDANSLAFWMANASELLHFLKSDRHISAFSLDAQDILAESVQVAFRNLVSCLQEELNSVMPHFLSDREDGNSEEESAGSVLHVLASAMALLRKCRVNAALTIQLFSQLFHFVNMWTFNKIVTETRVNYCTRDWGLKLKGRLSQIETWAEKQGLELAADCHLSRIIQTAHLLQAPKSSADDVATISSSCFKLNSLQLRALLQKYMPRPDEARLPQEMIENVVAENVADELARSDGREVKLQEEVELQLPFLLPEDGYSCDVVRGVPNGLSEFLLPLQQAGLCRMTPQPSSSGFWTIYMTDQSQGPRSPSALSNRSGGDSSRYPPPQQEPEVQVIKLHKSNNGMGLSIVAAKGAGQDRLGIYIKSVVKGGAADADGRLQAGDQLLKVDGQSLVGITQERAAEYLVRTGPMVTLEVAKQGAIYHGLATLLSQPSPVMGRAFLPKSHSAIYSDGVRGWKQVGSLPPSSSLSNLRSGHRDNRAEWNGARYGSMTSSRSSHSLSANRAGPRRMSERDLPTKVLSEQNHNGDPRRGLPLHQPAIQSSKSVPSLNSGNNDLIHTPPNSHFKQHEVYNPGYSRTSSTNSIPQKAYEGSAHPPTANGAVRSRSTQNLNDSRNVPPGQGHSVVTRQASNPSLSGSQQQAEGERFYQNISVYRNQEHQNHNGYPPPSPNRGQQHPTPHDERNQQQQKALRGSQSSLHRQVENMTGPMKDRPASSYIPQKDAYGPQNNQQIGLRSQSARDMLRQEAKIQEIQEEVRRREARTNAPHYPGHPPAGHPHARPPNQMQMQQQRPPNAYPASPYIQDPAQQGMHHHHHQQSPVHHSQQSISSYPPYGSPQSYPPHSQAHVHSSTYPPPNSANHMYPHPGPGQQFARHPPPTAPKPRMQHPSSAQHYPSGPEKPHRQVPYEAGEMPPVRPPPPEDGYSESPPPPPPTTTHPLYQPQKAPVQNHQQDNRYTASNADPPRGSYCPTSNANQAPRQYQFNATNPWEREEREKEQQRRREAARQWRDQQISELETLPARTAQQEEQLRALRLEREFQRRAEEAARQDDEEEGEDDDDTIDRRGLLRIVQEDLERSRQRRSQQENQNGPSKPPQEATWTPALEEAERQRKLEEMRRKQQELEAAREAEERLIHEAQKRKEEEMRLQQIQQQQELKQQELRQIQLHQQELQRQQHALAVAKQLSSPNHNNMHNSHPNQTNNQYGPKVSSPATGPLRLDNLVTNGPTSQYNGYPQPNHPASPHVSQEQSPPLPKSPPPSLGTNNPSGTQRLDSLLMSSVSSVSPSGSYHSGSTISPSPGAPPPPERGSSYAVMSQQGVLRTSITTRTEQQPPKRVSFHDSKLNYDSNANQERVREDPNNFINEAETLLATPRSPDGSFTGNTPGVIGAQEVYRDPRMRRLQEQQNQKMMASRTTPGPEKLTFKEKMKMFAMETGEDGTPKDKVKISKAQREIEMTGNQNNMSPDRN